MSKFKSNFPQTNLNLLNIQHLPYFQLKMSWHLVLISAAILALHPKSKDFNFEITSSFPE